ncbi:unnamed protein product [Amaranthus hypochondriacus]
MMKSKVATLLMWSIFIVSGMIVDERCLVVKAEECEKAFSPCNPAWAGHCCEGSSCALSPWYVCVPTEWCVPGSLICS